MTLGFPKVEAPLASIVIPTHNAWDWTSRALAAVREHTDRPYEVIVCDNASSDETPLHLAALKNARVVINTENLGFGVACNQGAALARSQYIVFLNSDAIVHENWLAPLLSHLESSPERWCRRAPTAERGRFDSGSRLDRARRRADDLSRRRVGRLQLPASGRLCRGRLSCDQARIVSRGGRLRLGIWARLL